MTEASGRGLRERWVSISERYQLQITPRIDGLPRLRVLFAFPVLLLLIGAILVGTSLNGSSSGAYYPQIAEGHDPNLIAGEPLAVRSDEWNVGIPWIIAQVEQGLPQVNQTNPGGMDADLPYDLPSTGISMVFKPHLWGFLFLDIGRAIAWKWWMPGLALIAAAFMFVVTVLPRRPILSAAIAVGFFFSPFFQWWYQTTTLWPVVWALVVLTAMLWCVSATASRGRIAWNWWLWSLPVAYFTVVMAMGVYVPFIIPVAYVVVFAAIGLVIQTLRAGKPLREVIGRAAPVIVGGVAGAAMLVIWLRSKQSTVDGFLSTVYPGERLWPTGGSGALTVAQTVSSSFSESLRNNNSFLGLNASEASTFFLVGVFLAPVLIWVIVRRLRSKRPLPWLAISLLAVVALFMAWLFVPGWDAVSHLLMLDRTTPSRLRIGLGLASLVLLVCVIKETVLERPGRIFASVLAGLFLISQVAVGAAVLLVQGSDYLWGGAPLWLLWAVLSAAAIFAFARGKAVLGAALFLVITLASAVAIHPLYRGVLDLRETAVSKAVVRLDVGQTKSWVGVGGMLPAAVLIESGVETMNGTQGAPSREMWNEIDPSDSYEAEWNRIGAVRWQPGAGEPVITNPAPDVILSTFDACSVFAQNYVGRVLADSALTSPCLVAVDKFTMPDQTLTIYDVVPSK